MTTDSEVDDKRTVSEIADIIKRQGYSTLTDAEIDEYVEWVSEVRAARHEAVMRCELAISQGEQLRADAESARERADEAFRRACAASPGFEVISDEQA